MSSFPTSTLLLILTLFLTLIPLSHTSLSINAPWTIKKGNVSKRTNQKVYIDSVSLLPRDKVISTDTFVGYPVLSSPREDACDSITNIPTSGENTIVVATWGECPPAQKAKNAELAGAKMLILVLKEDMQLDHPSLKNLYLPVNIEVLAIRKKTGDYVRRKIEEAQKKPKTDPESIFKMSYDSDSRDNVNSQYFSVNQVVIEYWMTATDLSKVSYDFLRQLANVLSYLRSKDTTIEFYPHYILWQNEAAGRNGFQTNDEKCVSGGRYCDPESKTENRLYGGEAVLEVLRQICLRDLDAMVTPDPNWWKYITAYVEKCVNTDKNKNSKCHEKAFKAAKISKDIIKKVNLCMRESFGASPNEDLATISKDNSILIAELNFKNVMNVNHYPTLYVNRELYDGSMRIRNREKLRDFICSYFHPLLIPPTCTEDFPGTEKNIQVTETSTDVPLYVGIVLGCVIIIAFVLYCAKEGAERELKRTMSNELAVVTPKYEEIEEESHDESEYPK